MFNVICFYFLSLVAIRGVDLLPHVENFLGARGKKFFRVWAPTPSFILTMQRYNILIAVHEYLPDFFLEKSRGQDGQGQNGQNRKRIVKNRHYNINILFIYSEQ